MNWLRTIVREVVGLFVDDGIFALSILAWLVVCALLFSHMRVAGRWNGIILFLGFALILIESATRFSRRSRAAKRR